MLWSNGTSSPMKLSLLAYVFEQNLHWKGGPSRPLTALTLIFMLPHNFPAHERFLAIQTYDVLRTHHHYCSFTVTDEGPSRPLTALTLIFMLPHNFPAHERFLAIQTYDVLRTHHHYCSFTVTGEGVPCPSSLVTKRHLTLPAFVDLLVVRGCQTSWSPQCHWNAFVTTNPSNIPKSLSASNPGPIMTGASNNSNSTSESSFLITSTFCFLQSLSLLCWESCHHWWSPPRWWWWCASQDLRIWS